MRANILKLMQHTVRSALTLLLLSAGAAQAEVALTAKAATVTLSDGQSVPMWGLFCGSPTATGVNGAPCTTATGDAQDGTTWQPPLITVQSGAQLDIALTNNLKIPTSLVIVGQLGGGLGGAPTRTPSPAHPPRNLTWPVEGGPSDPQFTPPTQADRVQSFGTEVAPGGSATLSWVGLKPGTYLLESGTHPSIQGPMGLYGVVVVTDSTTTPATAYSGVTYDKDVTLLLSEIDPVQNAAVDAAVNNAGFSETRVWSGAIGDCGDVTQPIASHTCYPPAVNYSPRYFLVNGRTFDETDVAAAAEAVPADATSGNVLLRFVNAGLRMHVPSVVGLDMNLVAEDGNKLPGLPKVQNEVFLSAGKTYDVVVKPSVTSGSYDPATFPIFDRSLGLSANNQRNGGMQSYLQVNGGALPSAVTAVANPDTYYLMSGTNINVSDPAKGVIANDVGVYSVQLLSAPANGTLTLNANGTFTYVPNSGTTSDSFTYEANGNAGITTTVTLAACTGACLGAAPTANADAYTSNVASTLHISTPGVLVNDIDPSGHPLTAVIIGGSVTGGTVTLNSDGSFTASPSVPPTGAGTATVTFQYNALNSQNTASAAPATATITFNGGSGLAVTVKDAPTGLAISDYRWIIEEDRTFYNDPNNQTNNGGATPVPSLGTNFHSSYMPVVAQGCVGTISCESGQTVLDPSTGSHVPAVCDEGNGGCRTDASQMTAIDPGQVHLDPTKRYYISILPGDGANNAISGAGGPVEDPEGSGNFRPFDIAKDCGTYAPGAPNWDPNQPDTAVCGHGMGGASIAAGQAAVDVLLQENPFPTAQITVFVFEDDSPLNGENDAGGGVDILATNEPGLGGFQVTLFDQGGMLGDATGQITYDMFNMPVSNALAGTIDPTTGLNACPIANNPDGIVGTISTCPKYESDGTTLSPLAGQAVIKNLYQGLYEVVATPPAEDIAAGKEWLQTNTLDGGKPHEAFIKPNEPGYFQEFGPGGYHVSIGFVNPATVNSRKAAECAAQPCNNTVTGQVTLAHMSRTPDQRIYSSGSNDAFGFTQCYVSLGDADGDDFAFAKCDANGRFTLSGIPDGKWRITVFDQWNDILVDGLAVPVALNAGNTAKTTDMGDVPMQQWRANLYTRSFIDMNGDGVSQDDEPGLNQVATNIRYRDGSYGFFNSTDNAGYAGFNEVFPFMNWLVVEADTTRYKQTGVHVVYDAGGPVDGTTGGGTSTIADHLANTLESSTAHLPGDLRFPGSVYCNDADCNDRSGTNPSTGRIDPAWVTTEGWQGLLGQSNFIEFGKAPFADGENGGIQGEVNYASTRPFDDPALMLQLSWQPNVPNVTVNLYKVGTAADGTESLTMVDTTKTSSWDDWAQGFRSDGRPNMNCPGQETTSPFYYSLKDSEQWLNPGAPLPYDSQFKCYDGWAMLNQLQPAPYDGMYKFPSVTARNPSSGQATGTNCTACVANPVDSTPMLPAGKYVVEVIVPPGYELMKEEDKNILLGDNFIAPVSQQFAGLGNIFIMPDQAAMNSTYNPYNSLNQTTDLGAQARHEGDTGSVETFWPCVGQERIVPDYVSLFPGSQQASPFAGATRHLCDRKEVKLSDQMTVLAKFYVFSSTHIAGHYTGIVTDDYASEFDPFSPSFGEKFAVPNVPVAFKDFSGNEITRVYSDQWGVFNGMSYSSWEVNPPNPTGYGPTTMVACMNDPGPIPDPSGAIDPATGKVRMITDPLYNPAYSNFCYEWTYMPGQTAYMDTPVVPTMAFAEGYNLPDCAYPDATPAIKDVTGDAIPGGGAGPWLSGTGSSHVLTITALGDQVVPNHAYSGPASTNAPFNEKFITRHYGFGGTQGTVTLTNPQGNPIQLHVTHWGDGMIRAQVPGGVCPASRLANGCSGQLVITKSNGKQSIDAVTVTVGGKTPTFINGENSTNSAIQDAIDAADPGDLLIVGAGTYNEMVLMWKPVQLQGVGAASVTLNANAHPAGKLLDPWRRKVACLFGLALNGQPITGSNPYDPTGTYSCTVANISGNPMQVDRVPMEGILGWDTTTNGNLAEMLQEPTLMGAYEGAGITVLAKGVRVPAGATDIFGSAAEAGFPAGTVLLTSRRADCRDFPSNFLCAKSRVDGISITNSSQGGGAIFLHGWTHNMELSNNRIFANAGTLSGGIVVGQGEFGDQNIVGDANYDPGLTQAGFANNHPNGTQAPYYLQHNVNVHNNMITSNASYGDELYSATPSAAGGVTFCTGSDYYKFNFNWVCGNLSTGDGGGVVHSGLSYGGDISHNWILFNQSNNPTIPTNGGGIGILGASPDRILPSGIECGSVNDLDCPPGLADGTGPGLVIDSNLIMGNTAESGSGGGIRLQGVNGNEVVAFPTHPERWYGVTITNNIISDNVAGWDGGGVSLQDALKVSFVNNTVVANDTTASAGVLFNTIGAPNAAVPPPGCTPQPDPTLPQDPSCEAPVTTSTDQTAGLVTMQHTPNLIAAMPTTVNCPGQFYPGGVGCRTMSLPYISNDLFWQNRTFHIDVGGLGSQLLNQQNVVALNPAINQTFTGECANGANFWDIGIRGDTGPSDHSSGYSLRPHYSIITDASDYMFPGAHNNGADPRVLSQYCNGARVPPENGGLGYAVPPGVADATSPNPLFNLTPSATVDEGNNWINMSYGPLSLVNNAKVTGDPGYNVPLGNYSIRPNSPAVDSGSNSSAPDHDFFGNPRPAQGGYDIGAVELQP